MTGADVAVIGFGVIGAVLARCLADRGADVIVLDAGSPMAWPAGSHLRNLPAGRDDPAYVNDLVRVHLRRAAAGATTSRPAMAAARTTNLLGGMGVLWNCVAPRLAARERWPGIEDEEWARLYRRAEHLLRVSPSPSGRRQSAVISALEGAGPAPIAFDGRRWTGPAEIARDVKILAQHAVRKLDCRGSRVIAAEAVDLATGRARTVEADDFIVAAGGLRTPALLWASGIGRDLPVGNYLTDHPLSYAQVLLDAGPADDPDPFAIVPAQAGRPFHGVLLTDAHGSPLVEGLDERRVLSLYWYTPTEQRRENRIVFTEASGDAFGLPRPTFEYSLSAHDEARRADTLAAIEAAGERIGAFTPGGRPRQLTAGSSMHVMGTSRIGTGSTDGASSADSVDSVVDGYGRVWGMDNLHLGGTGLLPTATATNPTLTAAALAVRTAEHLNRT
ncbi:GMC oxidoreductase [Amycolatopsis sp. PS_44_ISF1]|uniref:GMC oxidoreductase n=1 Tax=Amycolatopsis sp. PS_44_ISF1 TaxID=2974917 RepID=UPI0028DFDB32|nr:GMC oxidoreductase [Amycolatopsis sp. PS_44_ISF1]MDT8912290.1 GMC oxidoreductase [Amycolatopsis sp. PS_44_ISF1]